MKQRIFSLRKALHLSQEAFGKRLAISGASVSKIESGENNPSQQTLNLIVTAFNVNPEWLRNGTGSMFVENDASLVGQIAEKYGLSGVEQTVLASFLNLSGKNRAVVLDFFKSAVAHVIENNMDEIKPYLSEDFNVPSADPNAEIEAEVESYRQDLIEEKKAAAKSAPSENTSA